MTRSGPDIPAGVYDEIDFAVLLQIAGRMIAQHVEAIGRDFGLAAGHLSLLGMVHRKPGLVQNVYGEILAINDATLARYVDKLAARGLLRRERPETDRRTVRLDLTAEGREVVGEVIARLSGVREDFRARLSEAQVEQLHTHLVAFLTAEGTARERP
ncbi:MarR family winged helix-turn-helix transcriptional regulator [Roseobacteraceae bacterium NS-SX3]